MLTFRKSKSGENISINLKDEVGIEEAGKMKKYLIKGLSDDADVQINLEKATGLHITILQLIIAAFKHADKNKKKLSLKGNDLPTLKSILETCGMIYKDGLVLENEKNSFWVTGGM